MACSAASSASAMLAARLYGVDLRELLQRAIARRAAALLRDHAGAAVRQAARCAGRRRNRLSLYGLGIPPAQYEALAGGRDMAHGAARAGRAAGLRLQPRRQLLRLAGLRPLATADDAAGPLPPYLRREHFDAIRARADRVEVLNRSITEYLARLPRRLARPLRPARRPGLDDRRAAERAVARDHPHRAARRTRHLPHRRRTVAAARPASTPRCWRAGATRRSCRATSPRATARRSMAASTSTSSKADDEPTARRRGPDGPHLPAAAALLRPHPQVLSARPRPADRRSRAAARRAACSRSAAARRATSSPPRRAYPEAAVLRHRHLDRDAGHGAPGRSAGPASPSRIGLAHGDATRSIRPALFGVPCFSRIFFSYSLSMIPDWQAALDQALIWLPARRRTAHRRFRRPGAAAVVVPLRSAALAGAFPRAPARRARRRAGGARRPRRYAAPPGASVRRLRPIRRISPRSRRIIDRRMAPLPVRHWQA